MGNLGQVLQSAIDLENKQFSIINYYGMNHQINKLIEECAELIVAITEYKEHEQVGEGRIIDEMADIENLIEQIKLKDTTIAEGISRMKQYKVKRQLERIGRANR